MREIEIKFDSDVPVEIQLAVIPVVKENIWLAPSWIEFIYFRFEESTTGASLSSSIVEEYRKIVIFVRSNWLKASHEQRASDIRHEIVHAILDPLYQAGFKILSSCLDKERDKKLWDWAEEELRLGVEKATVDLEFALKRKLAE
jgi:hypothetical protein